VGRPRLAFGARVDHEADLVEELVHEAAVTAPAGRTVDDLPHVARTAGRRHVR
jgi:hypothetical protein